MRGILLGSLRYFSFNGSPSISAVSFLSSAPLTASSSHQLGFFLASLAGPLCALAPSGVLRGYCCCLFPLCWSSSWLHISALLWVVRRFFLWFLGDCPPSLPTTTAISLYPPGRLPLGSLSQLSPLILPPLGCSIDFACFPFGLALSHSFLGLSLTSGISAGVVLSLRLCDGLICIRYCLSLAHVGCLPTVGSSPFLPLAPPLLDFGFYPGSRCCAFLLRCPPPGLWPSSFPFSAMLPMFHFFSWLSVVGSHPSLLALQPLGPRFSSLVLAFLVSVVSVLLLTWGFCGRPPWLHFRWFSFSARGFLVNLWPFKLRP